MQQFMCIPLWYINPNNSQLSLAAGDSFKSLEDDAAPKDGVGGGGSETKDGVGGTHLKDNENGTVEKDSSTANAETPTKSSKLSIFGSKDKNKDKADKNALDNNSKMPLGLGKPKSSSDGFDGKWFYFLPFNAAMCLNKKSFY